MISLPADVTVKWLLEHASEVPSDGICFLPKRELTLADECMVVDWRELDPNDDIPADAVARGLTMSFGSEQVVDVLSNLAAQRPEASIALKLQALNHYLGQDAFIDLA